MTEIPIPTHPRTHQDRNVGTCGSIIGSQHHAKPSTTTYHYDTSRNFREKRLQPIESGKIGGNMGKNCAILRILGIKSGQENQIKKAQGRLLIPRASGQKGDKICDPPNCKQ